MNQQQGLRIKKLLIHETGTYNPQYRRPYNTQSVDSSVIATLGERLTGAQNYQPSMMAGIANQFIQPSANPERQIAIANGWNEPRLRFMMEIESNNEVGAITTELVLGYTDYVGVLSSQAIDPQMQFFVNSVTQTRTSTAMTPFGNQTHSSVFDTSHILTDNGFSDLYTPAKTQRLRPEDIFPIMSRSHLSEQGRNIMDMRSTATSMLAKSKRSNCSATNYMANILQSYRSAAVEADDFNQGNHEIYSKARGNASEQVAARDPFIMALASVSGLGAGSAFKFGDLLRIDPNVDNVTVAVLMTPAEKTNTHQTGFTADWGASNRETVVATILSQSIPGFLMELGLTRVVFTASNMDIGGQSTFVIVDVAGFSTGDQTMALNRFKESVMSNILRDISYDGQVGFAITMRVDLLGETWIKMSLDGGPQVDYVVPSFSDALMVPVMTQNDTLAITIASDFESLVHSIDDVFFNRNTNHSPNVFGQI